MITYICMSKTWQVQEYVYKKFLCSDSLFSFLHAEVIFSENNMNIYANRDKNKDVQIKSIECVLYLVQHLSNKTGKCISFFKLDLEFKMWMFTVGLCRKRWLIFLSVLPEQSDNTTPIGSIFKTKNLHFSESVLSTVTILPFLFWFTEKLACSFS